MLLPRQARRRSPEAVGTFVSLGTHTQPFDRLLALVDEALHAGRLPAPCAVQSGVSSLQSPRMELAPVLAPSEFASRLSAARYVVGHCGAGLISSALTAGHRPIVAARLRELGEHVDDHQVQLADKLAELGLVVRAEDGIDSATLREADRPLELIGAFEGLPEAETLLRSELTRLAVL